MSQQTEGQTDHNVEMWKMKKLIKSLEAARGWVGYLDERFTLVQSTHFLVTNNDSNGTSMISLIIRT